MKKESVRQALKFSAVGVLNTLVDYGVFYIMLALFNVDKSVSQVFATAVAMSGSYIINRHWTFKEKGKAKKGQIIKFIATNLISMSCTIIFMNFFHDIIHIHQWVNSGFEALGVSFNLDGDIGVMFCKIAASVLSFAVNFVGNKFWVFKEKTKK